ncbi:hypothetical protein [Streptosporangium amethystogenes]|uniref:hypothetical protein n=1 Tax=Streptosporangium amethystogenes TaxID=2002 RepID=UPI0004CA170D|nr:hypothetical protein [Streptosporangium amethystogenes]
MEADRPERRLGSLDLPGIVDLATDSTSEPYSGNGARAVRRRDVRPRVRLQAEGSMFKDSWRDMADRLATPPAPEGTS